jgi:hypothetical protein
MRVIEAGLTLVVVQLAGLLLLAYRDRRSVYLPDQLAALMTMLMGFAFAMLWELVAFILDWVASTDLQPSNMDTMLNLLACDVAAVLGAVLATSVYCRALSTKRQMRLGALAVWLSDGPSRMLDEHGFAITLTCALLVTVAVAELWFAGRPVPGFPIG